MICKGRPITRVLREITGRAFETTADQGSFNRLIPQMCPNVWEESGVQNVSLTGSRRLEGQFAGVNKIGERIEES